MMNTVHCLTRIRFVLVLRKIQFTLDDKFHFCGICIVMERLLLTSRQNFLLKKTHNLGPKMTKTSKCTYFFNFLCYFCPISRDFVEQNVEYNQQRMILLSNRVVCGNNCSFVKQTCNKDHEIVNKSYFFYIFVFSNATFEKISFFSWIKFLKRFNNN